MSSAKSTRLAIVEQSLADILERLSELPATEKTSPRIRELRAKAQTYERAVRVWAITPPNETQRAAMLKLVLELHVQVMEAARASEPKVASAPKTGYVPRPRDPKLSK